MPRQTRASVYHAEVSAGETTNAKSGRTRRTHKKSRKGCVECKNRHIRCDERKPACANCEIAERTCRFPPPKAGNSKKAREKQITLGARDAASSGSEQSNHSNIDSTGENILRPTLSHQQDGQPNVDPLLISPSLTALDISPPSYHCSVSPIPLNGYQSPPADSYPGLPGLSDIAPEATFTSQHMILLRNADTVPNFTGPNRNIVDIAIRHAVESPYLLDEILAFTAFHMAHVHPGSAAQLQHLATELQNRAMAAFNRVAANVPKDDLATAVPRFLFSAILGRHVLADTLAYCRSDFDTYINRFIECFNLNRGVLAVTPPARHYLYNTEIQPFLKVILDARKRITSPGSECNPLTRLMEESDLSETSAQACRQAIAVLQHSFDICRHVDGDEYPQAASVFAVGVEAGFIDVLRKHRPEGLIILAYYGVLLHRCRSFWAFGNAGASLIRLIASNVGSYWQEALAWPQHVLDTEQSLDMIGLNPGLGFPTTRGNDTVAYSHDPATSCIAYGVAQ